MILKWIFNKYNTSTAFHSFIQGLVAALIAALTSWGGGVPTNKAGLYALLAFIGKALFSWFTRWAQTQQATKAVTTTGGK
jgi:hypothetical protein